MPRDVGDWDVKEIDEQMTEEVSVHLWKDFLWKATVEQDLDRDTEDDFVTEHEDSPPPGVVKDAKQVIAAVEDHYGKEIEEVLGELSDDPESEYSDFAYYVAMQSLGHGVSWEDDHDASLWTPNWDAAMWYGDEDAESTLLVWL